MGGEPTRVMVAVNESTIKGYPHASISSRKAFEWTLQKIVQSNASGFKLHVQVPDEDDNSDWNLKYKAFKLTPLPCCAAEPSIFGGLKSKTDLPLLIHKCINKDIQLDRLLTHQVPMVDINRALELLKHSDSVKVVIKL